MTFRSTFGRRSVSFDIFLIEKAMLLAEKTRNSSEPLRMQRNIPDRKAKGIDSWLMGAGRVTERGASWSVVKLADHC